MPELPEVETIRRQLAPLVEGRSCTTWRSSTRAGRGRWRPPNWPTRWSAGASRRWGGAASTWCGACSGDVHLVQHLRMTGAVLCEPEPEPAHVRVRIELRPKRRLVIVDPRRFGTGELLLGERGARGVLRGAPGPRAARRALHGRAPARARAGAHARRSRRSCSTSAGSRASATSTPTRRCYRAGIHPLRPAGRLSSRAARASARGGDRGAAARASTRAGATIDDFRHVDGVRGSFQDQFLVHRREGEPCGACGTTIVKMVVGGQGNLRVRDLPAAAAGASSRGQAAASSSRPSALRGRSSVSGVAAEQLAVDEHLREAHHAGAAAPAPCAPAGSLERLTSEKSSPRAFSRPFTRAQKEHGSVRVDGDLAHYFIKYSL